MENGAGNGVAVAAAAAWNFAPNETLLDLTALSVRGVLGRVKAGMVADGGGARAVVPMGHGDPSAFPCFRTAPEAVDAVAGALRSGEHNSYATSVGLKPARRLLLGCASPWLVFFPLFNPYFIQIQPLDSETI
jgi:tyrosine aminotransferase